MAASRARLLPWLLLLLAGPAFLAPRHAPRVPRLSARHAQEVYRPSDWPSDSPAQIVRISVQVPNGTTVALNVEASDTVVIKADSSVELVKAKARVSVSDFKPGDTVVGEAKRWTASSGWFFDVKAEKDCLVEMGEISDGFIVGKMEQAFRRGKFYSLKVLDVTDGKLYLTQRTGTLDRPERQRSPTNTLAAVESLAGSTDWFEATVKNFMSWGVVVTFTAPNGDLMYGVVHRNNFDDGFATDASRAIRGGKVKVRVINVESTRVDLSLKES